MENRDLTLYTGLPETLPRRAGLSVPAIIGREGKAATQRFLEFFTANIRNPNTRSAYARAAWAFLAWCEERGLDLKDLQPVAVAAYIEELGRHSAAQTVKQHLAAVRMLFDWLVIGQVVPANPATCVRGPKYVITKGKTPVLSAGDARKLLEGIGSASAVTLRDRALIAAMVYSFARVEAVVRLRVEDYYENGRTGWLRLHEKGGKFHEVPVHHKAAEYLDAYIAAAGISGDKKGPLLRTAAGRTGRLTGNPMSRTDALLVIKRRCREAGLPGTICCHSFRATGITAYLENGGTLEHAQAIAAHSSPRTTKLYDRTSDTISLDEIERILI